MRRITLIILITLLATPTVHAQVTIEVSKITCDQYLGFTVADPRDINIWLSGYYHGQQGSTALEPQRLKEMAKNRMPAQRKSERAGDAGHQKDSGISLVPRQVHGVVSGTGSPKCLAGMVPDTFGAKSADFTGLFYCRITRAGRSPRLRAASGQTGNEVTDRASKMINGQTSGQLTTVATRSPTFSALRPRVY